MGNFDQKVNKFIEIFVEQNGYAKVIQGLQNTLLIAVTGLIIGIIVGTLIATVRVLPKYKTLPKVLNGICSFYVALFRGTPMVVQLNYHRCSTKQCYIKAADAIQYFWQCFILWKYTHCCNQSSNNDTND